MTYLAIDWGKKRIGLAVGTILPQGAGVVDGAQPFEKIADKIKKVISEFKVEKIIIGLPVLNSGDEGNLAGEIRIDIRLSSDVKRRHNEKLNLQTGFESSVAALNLYPGMPEQVIENILDNGIKGLVLSAFGSGNLSYEYVKAIEKAKAKKIPVAIDTQCLQGATLMHLYDVGKMAMDAGAIQTYDMSFESVITKLMWALKHAPYEKIEEIMLTNYTGEINKEAQIY